MWFLFVALEFFACSFSVESRKVVLLTPLVADASTLQTLVVDINKPLGKLPLNHKGGASTGEGQGARTPVECHVNIQDQAISIF
jgi:hypothetical protein